MMDEYLEELFFDSVAVMKRNEKFAMITLVNKAHDRQINIITDRSAREQLLLRLQGGVNTQSLLPEVFDAMLNDVTDKSEYQILIQAVVNGEYITEVYNSILGVSHRIRVSDAILMSVVTGIPLFIERSLLARQSTVFVAGERNSAALPINAMPLEALEQSLEACINNEEFEMASKLAEEIKYRKQNGDSQKGV